MIIEILKDFSVSEISKFAEEYPKRYENLCQIVGEFSLALMGVYLAVTFPFSGDKGCVAVSTININKQEINIIDVRYF